MPADDESVLNPEKYDGMASKVAAHSTLNPNAPFFFPAAFPEIEDFSAEWWNLVHSSPAFRDYWIRERMHYVDGAELTAEDVDHLEAMVDFIDQEEPDVTVDESLEDFIFQEIAAHGDTGSNFIAGSNSAAEQEKQQEEELVKSIKRLDLKAHIPQALQKEQTVYHDKLPLSPSKLPGFSKKSAMHRIQQPR
ncbi:hypothetical protein O6H91_10G029000 [Diphasiastrum complanatum]|uniref:Uncharacterized protein n=1 Tax=Diphasiastrum complanatum TaxID=34168 RepID=A0ACC2CFC0_DIPCM|nr:hypothetical protein O6H91_Y306600 [Diphasiastrum complanatum]KAJ7540746.1 hypothetical protein O6H91_10G029000 [Diphasiastrum complanatum]